MIGGTYLCQVCNYTYTGQQNHCPVCNSWVDTKKLEDIPIGVPFVFHAPVSGNDYAVAIKVDEKNNIVEVCDSYGIHGVSVVYGPGFFDEGTFVIVDWFEDDPQPWPQSHLCSCSIVALMQGGCKCGGK